MDTNLETSGIPPTEKIEWRDAEWLHVPLSTREDGNDLLVTADERSDAWRITSYAFIHDSAHALLVPFAPESAIEVEFVLDYVEQFDQAGIFVHIDAEHWIKAGIEISDGAPQLGAVVTNQKSDWSLSPVDEWAGKLVTIRASRSSDAVTFRARAKNEPWLMFRLAPLEPDAIVTAGPLCASPSRAGLTVRFTAFRRTPPDASLH